MNFQRLVAPVVLTFALVVVSPIQAASILLVTTNNGTLTVRETTVKTQLESWGYTVNTIWDGAAQATFNAAFPANAAVYVPRSATAGDVLYKVRETTIGVINEQQNLTDEFGFSSSGGGTSSAAAISVTNNSHYITNTFAIGSLTVSSSSITLSRMGGTTASGATVLGTVAGNNALVAVSTGATLANTYNGSNTAFGRRVHMPIYVGNNLGTLTASGRTLVKRAVDWAASAGNMLVAHWKLNETSGTSAADASDNGYTGTVTGTSTWAAAVLNNGFTFNGATRIQATGLMGSPTNVSVAAWANLTAADTNGAEVISLGDRFVLRLDEGGVTKATFYNGSAWVTVSTSVVYAGTGWHHFAAVFDNTGDTFRLYVDGVNVATTSTTANISYTGAGSNTVIGRNGNSGTSNDFTGAIDDVRVYNYALSASEVASLYGFVGHWKLSETSGTTAADSTVFARNGTVTGGAGWSTDCAGAGNFDFNGSSQYISIANASNLQPTGMISIAAWIKGDSFGTGTDTDAIVRKGEAGPNNYQLSISGGRVCLNLDTSDGAGVMGATYLDAGRWYHVAASWDGTTARIYVNGVLDGTGSKSGSIATDTRPLYIGGRSGANFFDGMMRDVRLYNRPLLATELARISGWSGYWKFNEGTGLTAADSSGLGLTATLSGGASWTSDCTGNNNALLTNGAGGIAQTPSSFSPPSEGTVAFWMRGSGTPATRGRVFGVNGDWEVRQEPNGTLSFDLGGSPYVGNEPFSTLDPVDTNGQWYHIAAVFSDTDNSFSVYIDGALRTSGISPVDLVPQPAGVLSFGTRTGSSEYWLGALRDFRVYNRKLCASEVRELAGFVGHWKLDETVGTVLTDSSGMGYDGTYQGSPLLGQAGADNTAVQFDGTNYAITDQTFYPPSTGTVVFWMRRYNLPTGRERPFGVQGNWEIWQDPDGLLRFDLGGDGYVGGFESIASLLTLNKWYHVAAVFDADNDTYAIYIDGALDKSGSMALAPQTAGQLKIAGRAGLAIEQFQGRIDDLRIYSRKLCPAEIQALYNSGTTSEGVKIIKWIETQ